MENKSKTVEHQGTKNLRPWKKGQSGNPKGRPKGPCIRTTLMKYLQLEYPGKFNPITGETMSVFESIIFSLLRKADQGDVAALKEILDRLEGKPIAKVLNKNEHNFPQNIKIEFVKPKNEH